MSSSKSVAPLCSFDNARARLLICLSVRPCTNQPDSKTSSKLLKALTTHYTYLRSKADPTRTGKKGGSGGSEEAGEYAGVLEEEWENFVWMEVGRIV